MDRDRVQPRCRDRVEDGGKRGDRPLVAGVEASTVGGGIVYNRLAAALMGIPGVYDISLDI